jgi:glucokinase
MTTQTSEDFVIGVDIGGTKVSAGLVDSSGKILFQGRVPMAASGTAAAGLASVTSAIDSILAKASGGSAKSVQGIGICSPGPLDPTTGVVLNSPNLPCWRNYPLAAEVSRIYDVPVKVDNDANAAALAEALMGAGRGYCNVFYVTVGTGIGTGIVFDGRIYHGRTGAAGEGGHMSIDYRGPHCACGKPGCIEVLAAGPAIARRAREKLQAGRSSSILDLAGGNIAAVTGEMVGQAYASGDALANEVLREVIADFSFWMGNVIDLLEPDVIIVGGGVASMIEPFFPQIRELLPAASINPRSQEIPIVLAQYREHAGIVGGATLCFDLQRKTNQNI